MRTFCEIQNLQDTNWLYRLNLQCSFATQDTKIVPIICPLLCPAQQKCPTHASQASQRPAKRTFDCVWSIWLLLKINKNAPKSSIHGSKFAGLEVFCLQVTRKHPCVTFGLSLDSLVLQFLRKKIPQPKPILLCPILFWQALSKKFKNIQH